MLVNMLLEFIVQNDETIANAPAEPSTDHLFP